MRPGWRLATPHGEDEWRSPPLGSLTDRWSRTLQGVATETTRSGSRQAHSVRHDVARAMLLVTSTYSRWITVSQPSPGRPRGGDGGPVFHLLLRRRAHAARTVAPGCRSGASSRTGVDRPPARLAHASSADPGDRGM